MHVAGGIQCADFTFWAVIGEMVFRVWVWWFPLISWDSLVTRMAETIALLLSTVLAMYINPFNNPFSVQSCIRIKQGILCRRVVCLNACIAQSGPVWSTTLLDGGEFGSSWTLWNRYSYPRNLCSKDWCYWAHNDKPSVRVLFCMWQFISGPQVCRKNLRPIQGPLSVNLMRWLGQGSSN